MDRPLSDVVVLDLTRALAGPIAGRLLADLGAEVIKIEPPDGDLTRAIVPRVDGMAAYYVQYNAGKRCVSIDLGRPEGRDLFLRMVEKADVVLENYRPDVMARLGLGYDVLAAHNPGSSSPRSAAGATATAARTRRVRLRHPRRGRHHRDGRPPPRRAGPPPQRPDVALGHLRRPARPGRGAGRPAHARPHG
ncbi:MAG: CoA transferase [Acidimicrobiales bacterium]